MAINPIQLAPRQPKKDPMDKILQGLQIANEVFKIPVAIQDFRSKGAEADLRRDQQQGITTSAQAAEKGIRLIPVPNSESGALGGPQHYGAPLMPMRVRNGDQVTEQMGYSQDANDKFFKAEKSLREEYTGHGVTKNTSEMYQAAQRIKSIIERNAGKKLGAADLAIIYGFGKLNDPSSAVREGELDLAKQSQGLGAQFSNIVSALKSGTMLGEEGRKALGKVTDDIISTQMELQSRIDNRYRGRSKEQGFKEENIIDNAWSKKAEQSVETPGLSPEQQARLKYLLEKQAGGANASN